MEAATHMLRTGRRGALFEFQMAFRDLRASGERIDLAWSLAWHDVVSRYRGSILGPFWITLSMGVMVLGIRRAPLGRDLPGARSRTSIPFVALGIVFFGTVTSTINEGLRDLRSGASSMLSQTGAADADLRLAHGASGNLINLGHHLVIVLAVLIYFGLWKSANYPVAALGLVLMVLNVSWLSMLVAIASARFRDIPQIVTSVTQAAALMTPVFWLPDRISASHRVILDFNPFYHLLEAIRAPLLGTPVAPHTYLFLAAMGVVGWTLTFAIFARTRRRIVHYL